jgi:hypothetical protein
VKKIAIHVGLFVIVFLLGVIIFFPYSLVVGTVIDQQIEANKIPIRYRALSSNLFKTTIKDVTVNYGQNIDLGDFYVRYTPLSAITRSVKAGVVSHYGVAEVSHKKDRLKLNAVVDLLRITRLFDQRAEGELRFDALYDLKSRNGTFDINGGAFAIQTPLVRFVGDNITGTGTIDGNVLTITMLEARGQSGLRASGRITLDTNNIRRSFINISGEASILGLTSRFTVRGTLGDPQFALQ